MVYKTYLEKFNIPENKEVWGFNCREEDKIFYIEANVRKPIKGTIKDGYFDFYEYKNGKLDYSRINMFEMNYADTYEEAKEAFNNLVQDRIKKIKEEIKYLSSVLLKNEEIK